MLSSLNFVRREPRYILILVLILSLLLPALAIMQYRWLGQLSEAQRRQMREILQAAANRLGQDFDTELSTAIGSFRMERSSPGNPQEQELGNCYVRWIAASRFPQLIREVYLVAAQENSALDLQKYVPASDRLEETPWPEEMVALRGILEQRAKTQDAGRSGMELPPLPVNRMPQIFDAPASILFPLIRPPVLGKQGEILLHVPNQFIILVLDLDSIRSLVLPTLAQRHFPGEGGSDIELSVVSRDASGPPIFQTDFPNPISGAKSGRSISNRKPDVTSKFFGVRPGGFRPLGPTSGMPQQAELARGGAPNSSSGDRIATVGTGRFDRAPELGLWEIQIRHRAGSLEAAVANERYRQLAISFGILLLLCGSIVAIVVSTRHARKLAHQQIEFIAAVTHELRTPIAAIQTAGQNLADGLVVSREQTNRYGTLISRESRRLSAMLEQVLDFASGQSRMGLNMQVISVENLIDHMLAASQILIQEQGFQIEKDVEANLPPIAADEASLRRALRNLLDNAMKYSGQSRWIRLRSRARQGRKGKEIQISIEDRGVGIPQDEISHIFEPFFRGQASSAGQIHGSGLGLSLVRSVVEAHRGRMMVQSTPGSGSIFSVILPAAENNS